MVPERCQSRRRGSRFKRPPGLTRRHFGFMGWMDYDVQLWTELRDSARDAIEKKLAHPVIGSDERRDAIEHSRTNARAAGVGHLVQFDVRILRDFEPPAGPPGNADLQSALWRTHRRGKRSSKLVSDTRRSVSENAGLGNVDLHRQSASGGYSRSAAARRNSVFQRQNSLPFDSIQRRLAATRSRRSGARYVDRAPLRQLRVAAKRKL